MNETTPQTPRLRREPPRFRQIMVARKRELTPGMLRVTFGGDDLAGLVIDEPAASVRLLVPSPGSERLVVPTWEGNEFLLPDGSRPVIRTFTPRRFDAGHLELDLDIVIHESGLVSGWAVEAGHGAHAAVSGPGRGYRIDPEASRFVLAGDESAIPAISQLLESIPHRTPVKTIVEVRSEDAIPDLPGHPGLDAEWLIARDGAHPGDALVDAVVAEDFDEGAHLWAAGEAAAVHSIRRALLGGRLDRSRATIRGYWKHDRRAGQSGA